jgi:hypothetical protein
MKPLNLTTIFLFFVGVQTQFYSLSDVGINIFSDANMLNCYYQIDNNKRESAQSKELPVRYKSFTAKRLRTKVDLVWETTWESNNSGFEIQRKMGEGPWQKVAFVFSQAIEGSSNAELTYEYTDVNTVKAESQYRLRQIDKDQQTSFSEVRSIESY